MKEKLREIIFPEPNGVPCGSTYETGNLHERIMADARHRLWKEKHPVWEKVFYRVPGILYVLLLLAIFIVAALCAFSVI
jgi:hypothetical protein